MTNNNDKTQKDEVQRALDTIQQMKNAAYRRAAPSLWFGTGIALSAGSLVSLAVADMRSLQVLSICMIAILIVANAQKSGATSIQLPIKVVLLGATILLPLYFAMIIFGQYLSGNLGQIPASLLSGFLFAGAVYTLNLLENRWYINKNT